MSEISFSGSPVPLVAGRYRIIALIGQGATAVVYRARDEQLGRDVALKLFPAQPHEAVDGQGRVESEMQLLATFNHPALVTLYDAGTDTTVPDTPRTFLSMELIDGPDLHTRLGRGPLPAIDVARIGAELASALAYLHGRRVIHRDIKPANVLLSEPQPGSFPRTKLADFGIARLLEGPRLTAAGTTVGTAPYLSPEQVTGALLGVESDIYSLGLVLLECLTGTVEYPGSNVESAIARLHRSPRIPDSLGPQWSAILAAMTATEPSDRPPASEVETALTAVAGTGVPGALPRITTAMTQRIPDMPNYLPRAGTQPAGTRVLIPKLPVDSDEYRTGTPAPSPAAKGQWHRKLLGLQPGAALFTGAGLVVAILVVLVVVVLHTQAPAPPVPQPLPSISGDLGQHIEQLKRNITP
ncbi:serine/threonine-protein kinase [Arthrobacter alkaliphilus]|uniref:serine/threonine-protein kinase n=1 Tax=Arthrobacter alkaliphilus TaxID=369936 RepID=UPI001F28E8B4|nr:serine/threonine-protein kinase [Arthrobacter alkaliphilus]